MTPRRRALLLRDAESLGEVCVHDWASPYWSPLTSFWTRASYKILRVVLKGNLTGAGAKGAKAAKEAD